MNRLLFERFTVVLASLCLLLAGPALAQEDQSIDPPADLEIPEARVLSPEEALESFVIEEGFEIQLVAAEPLIEDPVCMAWDGDGRLWVCEMKGYMPDQYANGEQEPVGNIVILTDTDGDGQMDQREVWMDEIVLPRAIAFAANGVLYADTTTLWYVRMNSNGSPGARIPVDRAYSGTSNVEHQANGLLYGLDNRFYNAKSNRVYQQVGSRFIRQESEGRGQWGITQDDDGHLLANSNSVMMQYELFPPNATRRNENFNFNQGGVLGREGVLRTSNRVYPIRVTPGVNRAYRPNVVSHETWRLINCTAVCGPVIYRGDQFPDDFYGNVFVPEPAGHLLKRVVIGRDADGRPTATHAYEDREFLASTDERCRFVNAYTGPDGCLYLVDMYRGLIQHQTYISQYLRRQIAARDLGQPIGLGRIYRVVYTGNEVDHSPPNLTQLDAVDLVPLLGHANAWYRETAQRMLVQGRRDDSAIAALEVMATEDENPQARIHALWALQGMRSLSPETLVAAGQSENERVRVQVLRLSELHTGSEQAGEFVALLQRYAQSPSWTMDLQLAFTAGVHASLDTPQAYDVLLTVLERRGNSRFFRHAIISGLEGKEAAMLALVDEGPIIEELTGALLQAVENGRLTLDSLLTLVDSPDFAERRNDFLKQIANLSASQSRMDVVDQLIARLQEPDATVESQLAILEGLAQGQVQRNAPIALDGRPALFDQWAANPPEPLAELIGQLDTIFAYERSALDPEAEQRLLAQLASGQLHYAHCTTCHGQDGMGVPGAAPPLVNSEWVQGHPEMLATLVLYGIEGDIPVNGRTYIAGSDTPGVMNGMLALFHEHAADPLTADEDVADLLTYIRAGTEFQNNASPVDVSVVTKVREANADRTNAFEVAYLWDMNNRLLREEAEARGETFVEQEMVIEVEPLPVAHLVKASWLDSKMLNLVIMLLVVAGGMAILFVFTAIGSRLGDPSGEHLQH